MENFITQLKQRQVFKVATIYVVAAWPLISIADILAGALGLPESVLQLLLMIFIVGFPISLVFAWLIDFTPQGMVRAGAKNDEQQATGSGYKVNLRAFVTVAGSLALALLITLSGQLLFKSPAQEEQLTADAAPGPTDQSQQLAATIDDKQSIAVLPPPSTITLPSILAV